MSLQLWLLFCATETMLCFTPGPAVLLVVSQSLANGTQAGLSATLGILTTNAIYFVLSATGLGAMLAASSRLFSIVKWIGAVYLVWIGGRMIRGRRADGSPVGAVAQPPTPSNRSSFSLAVLTQGANPKALVFFTAILPQFVDPGRPMLRQVVILGASSIVIELIVLSIYVATCHTARAWVRRPRFVVSFQRLGGACLIAAGARLAVTRQT